MMVKPEGAVGMLVTAIIVYVLLVIVTLRSGAFRVEMKLLLLGLLTAVAGVVLAVATANLGVNVQVQPGLQAQAGWSFTGDGPVAALSKIAVLLILGALALPLLRAPKEPAATTTGGTTDATA